MKTSGWYRQLGLRPVINAAATLTSLGGSLMPGPVLESMADAAGSFVDIVELQERVGARLAQLTHNEAGYVVSGAAAGITLAVAACITGSDPDLVEGFPYLDREKRREVVIERRQRNGWQYAAALTGARIVEYEDTAGGLEAVISDRTACVLSFAGARFGTDVASVERVVKIAHAHSVPVIVDAAAQIPPISSLWNYTRDAGADLVIVSGGKGLRGPQCSGLVLGAKNLVESCRANGNPNMSIGRGMKVGKEEMIGLLAAVEWYLEQDEAATMDWYESTVRRWIDGLAGIPGVAASRGYPNEAGQPFGRAIVRITTPCRRSRDETVQELWDGDPRVAVGVIDFDAIALNPQTLGPDECEIVLARLRALLLPAESQ
jgi:L-seryl-tRNA(Ser) seleniumtransferase